MYGRFTEKAEKAIAYAQEGAMKLGHNYVGTEHLLLGLVQEGTGVAAHVLRSQDVTLEKVIKEIENLIGKGEQMGQQPLGFTPRTKRVLELSFKEARSMGQNYIGTEHLLLGMLKEGDSVAIRILLDLGVDIQKLASEIMRMLKEEIPGAMSGEHIPENTDTPTLNQFGRDLTEMAREDKFDPVIGRDKEIERVIQILTRRTKKQSLPHRRAGCRKNCHCGRPCPENSQRQYTGNFEEQENCYPGPGFNGSRCEIPR